jgi:hypothetical protein
VLLSCTAGADVVYLTQDRSITVMTSADGNVQDASAPDFGPFLQSLALSTPFPTPTGGTGVNGATAGIDCQLDPNAIRVVGSLSGSGGIGVVAGQQTVQFGEAQARINTTVHITEGTPFRLTASPRPSTRPGDRFKIKLKDETRHTVLFLLDESSPPQAVDMAGTFAAMDLELEYQVELTVDGPEVLRDFSFHLSLGDSACYGNCDESTAPPILNANDFQCFLNEFASGSADANCDQSTAVPVLNVNDFQCFVNRFAAGCP